MGCPLFVPVGIDCQLKLLGLSSFSLSCCSFSFSCCPKVSAVVCLSCGVWHTPRDMDTPGTCTMDMKMMSKRAAAVAACGSDGYDGSDSICTRSKLMPTARAARANKLANWQKNQKKKSREKLAAVKKKYTCLRAAQTERKIEREGARERETAMGQLA